MASLNIEPDEGTSPVTQPGTPEKSPNQTTRDALLERFKKAGFQKASSPNGGGCVITGFPPPVKPSPETPQNS
jgi:hypothetical protein